MLLGCIADDFTGASDLANTLAQGGMATIQFTGIPQSTVAPACEAGVVALKTRSIDAADAVEQSLAALDWLHAQGCRQFLFKYCSTFDSTPDGNIGPVAEALADALEVEAVSVCPAFPATQRTLFMGHLFVQGRLLNETGMAQHPLNPMTDADLCRWLRRQTRGEVGLVPYPVVYAGAEAIAAAMLVQAQQGQKLQIIDAVVDEDLRTIGQAVADHSLVTGGSGIALGLSDNFRRAGLLAEAGSGFTLINGPGAILSGSCSTTSNAQVAHHLASYPGLEITAPELMAGDMTVATALQFVQSHIDQEPIIYSTANPEAVQAAQDRYGRAAIAERFESFFAELAIELTRVGISRLAVGGGETSGAVVTALELEHLRIGPEIDPGIPALATDQPEPLRLALKSGNFGSTGFYHKALCTLGSA